MHLGDAFTFWTDEKYLSKWHRVGTVATQSRITMPYFVSMKDNMPMHASSTHGPLQAEANSSSSGDNIDTDFTYSDWFLAAVPKNYKAVEVIQDLQRNATAITVP